MRHVRVRINELAESLQRMDRASIVQQLDKILSSSFFEGAERSRALLRFAVDQTLAGRGDQLKEYTLALECLGREPSFDPRTDPIVRAEVSRLRTRLELYYARQGAADPVLIVIPKGSYVPQFTRREAPAPATQPAVQAARPSETRRLWWLGLAFLGGIGCFYVGRYPPRETASGSPVTKL